MDLRELERHSIRTFLQHVADTGVFRDKDVLDYGCGRQPYQELVVMAGGRYKGFDRAWFPASTVEEDVGDNGIVAKKFDVILSTQVIQYVPDPRHFLSSMRSMLRKGGCLVITWPTNWPEVEKEDLHRFTQSGMARLLGNVGFNPIDTSPRAWMDAQGSTFYLGHGAIAWK